MEKERLERAVKLFMEAAKVNLKRDGYLKPVAILVSHTREAQMLPLSFSSEEEKQSEFAKITQLAVNLKTEAIFLISEGWLVILDKKEPIPPNLPRPTNHPDRVECIRVDCETNRYVLSSYTPFHHKRDGTIGFGETKYLDADPMKCQTPFSLAFRRAEGRA